MPYIHQVAVGRLPELKVYGDDYPTKDGTPVSHSICFVFLHITDCVTGNSLWLCVNADPGLYPCNGLGRWSHCCPSKAFCNRQHWSVITVVKPVNTLNFLPFFPSPTTHRQFLHWLGCTAYNLGTGRGTSVLEMVAAFEKASGKVIVHFVSSSLTSHHIAWSL